jgi:cytochrome b561
MLLGITITRTILVATGAVMLALLAFQILVGLRKITFKGKLHPKVHRVGAYVMVAVAAVHALAALAFVDII